ncbi:hypothetical protein A3H26_02405 [candidate division WWE3 bacterium RIFCSPLOWO2_12_FULL_36_10]|uniref:Lipid II isoglutaminyl synthase (glutamine-hydrolyzing) subunit GatD n=1 Tax=candidate division WWE3 bacterium RIFCSPLOWO2_12_FULL_36_10 TaxID=1802630 RepID=A0A1F4VJT9_UNCKA|nr:MAG: hypothetical protein A3H26_02405 [candidate division WWE3 bacterium RIFCSPLOWO2_12_FULL_36_10]
MKFKIGYFYPEQLNLYGDNGNVEILVYRAKKRGIDVEVALVDLGTNLEENRFNLVFMGGGPDSSQKEVYEDLLKDKGPYLKDYINSGGFGLYICGAYQLLGKYYKSADGSILEGLGVFDLYTEHFGNKKPRCIGNVVCELSDEFRHKEVFNSLNKIGSTLVGFENHGGRTYLGEKMLPLGKVITGYGNNSEDGYEGVLYKNSIGTYLHGPVLSKNPHLADYLIAGSLGLDRLESLDDSLILSAHIASKKLRQ